MRVFAAVVVLVGLTASAEPLELGLAWLRAQQGPDGELGASRGEDTLISTAEAVTAWRALGLETQPETLAALSALAASPRRPDTEVLLRKYQALAGTGWDFSATTFAGHAEGFDAPEPWLQAYSLLDGPTDAAWLDRANALVARLDGQGCLGWADNGPSPEVTAMTVLAIRRRSDSPALLGARAALVSCLLTQQRAGGDFGGAAATALALIALQSVPQDTSSAVAAARSALLAMQAANGSWGSVRATALALRALGAASPDWVARSEFGRALVTVSAASFLQGSPAQVRAQFRNASAVAAPPVQVRFSVKQGNATVLTRDAWLPSMTPGQLVEVSTTLPTDGLAGQYALEAEANAQRLLPELDTTNNVALGTLSVLVAADVSLTSQSIQFLPDTATTARVRVTAQNRGSTLPSATTVSVWAFAPRTGRPLGSFVVPAGTAQGQAVSGEFVFSTADLSGFTAIHAVADPDGLLEEYDEGNNTAARYFEKGAQNVVDVAASGSCVTLPSPAQAGSAFTLRVSLYNLSSQPAQRVGVSIVENATGQEVARGEVPVVPPGPSIDFDLPVVMSQPGTVTMVLDPDLLLNDSNRGNNTVTLSPSLVAKSANLSMQDVTATSSGLVANLRADGLTRDVGVLLREVTSGRVVARATAGVRAGTTQGVSFEGVDMGNAALVYEACADPDNAVDETVETDNCAELSASTARAFVQVRTEEIRFEPFGASVGEQVRVSALVENRGTSASTFFVDFYQGPPTTPQGRRIGRTRRLSAPAGGSVEATLDWVRTDGPVEVYARVMAVDGRVEQGDRRGMIAGRHLFLEEIFDVGLPANTYGGVQAVRSGRVSGQQAPDLVVSYFVANQPAGVAMISSGPTGRQVAWRRPLGQSVEDVALVDVDRDGTAEVVVSYHAYDGFPWMLVLDSQGNVRWSHVLTTSVSCGSGLKAAVTVGDLDGNGAAELVYFAGDSVIALDAATGATTMTSQPLTTFHFQCGFTGSMYVADTNGDGRNEVLGVGDFSLFDVERDGSIRWVTSPPNNSSDTFALSDLDGDGEPELVLPVFKGATFAYSSATGALKYASGNTDSWPGTLAIGPVRQNGLPYTLGSNNNWDHRVTALAPPGLGTTWSRVLPTDMGGYPMTEATLADLEGRGRPQLILSNKKGGPVFLDARDGKTLLERSYELLASETQYTGPVVVADLDGRGTSSKVVVGFVKGSGTGRPSFWYANYFDGNVLIYGSPHWKRQPTAWPTRALVKGAIGEDLKLGSDYRWWTTHNTHNQQFFDAPATSLADVQVSLAALAPVAATQSLAVPVTVTNVGGVAASGIDVALYDGQPADGGTLVARATVPGPLAPRGGAAPLTLTWRAYPEGAHRLCVVVNADGAVQEPDGEGNTACRPLLVGATTSGCDLAVVQSSLSLSPSAAQPGEAVSLSVSLHNVGSADCDATTVVLDDGPPSNRIRLGQLSVPALAVGAVHSARFAFTAQSGARQWLVTVDPAQQTLDVDRSNDVGTLDGFFSDAALPDLVVEAATATPRPAFPGESLDVRVQVRNLGAPSTQSSVALGAVRATVPPLASGEAVQLALALTAGAFSSVADVRVDPDAAVAELNEENNTLPLSLEVLPSPLRVSALATPSAVGPNTPIALAVQLLPQDGVAHAVTLGVSLLDAAGQPLAGVASLPVVVPASGSTQSVTWDTGTTPAGSYVLQVRAEAGGRLLGATAVPVQVLPGSPGVFAALTPSRATVPAGGDVVLSFLARNTSSNLTLQAVTATLSVFDATGQLVFRALRQLGVMQPGASFSSASVVSLGRGAAPGRYTVTLAVADGATGLAQAAAGFDVVSSDEASVAVTLSAGAAFQVGVPLTVEALLENEGATALSGQLLTVELVNSEAGLAVESAAATVVTLAAHTSQSQVLGLQTTGLATGQKLLVARLEGRVVDVRPVTALPRVDLEAPRVDVSGISDGEYVNHDVRPVVVVTDASDFVAAVTLDGAAFTAGDVVTGAGPHALVVEAVDVFGNRSWLLVRFVIDRTPPVLTLTGPADGSLHRTAQALAWAATDEAPVTTRGTLGSASILSGAVVATEGAFTWAVVAEDAAGNVTSETRRFEVDGSAPVITLGGPAAGSTVRGPVVLGWAVADAHPGVVEAWLDGVPVAGGSVSVAAEGAHALLVTSMDAAGNSASAALSFTIDDTPPVISLSGVTDGALLNTVVTVTYAATDAVSVSAALDGATFVSGTVISSEGSHHLEVVATDAAGNTARRAVDFELDFAPPAIAVTGVVDGAVVRGPVMPAVAVTDAHLLQATASLNGAAFVSGTAISAEGSYLLDVSASDGAGNQASRTVRFTLDATPPVLSVTGVFDGQGSSAPLTPAFGATDATLAAVTGTLDGLPFASGTAVSAAGAHVLRVVALDGAGNEAHVTVSFTITSVGGACVDVGLVARRSYVPSRWEDAEAGFSRLVRVAVPWTLPVTQGNAGNKRAYLFLRTALGTSRCVYEGGSPLAHPRLPADVAAGLAYRFVSCSGGLSAGVSVEVDAVRLHLHDGDTKAGETEVSWRLQELQPCVGATVLPPLSGDGVHCGHEALDCIASEEDDFCDGGVP